MKHVFWLVPGRLAGRCGPQDEPWSLSELRDLGIHAILNLSEFEPDEADHKSAGITVAWIPLPNVVPADDGTEEKCVAELPRAYEFLRSHLDADRNVLVHCWAGKDRTGMILAYHLTQTASLSPKEAIARVRKVRPQALSAPGWEQMAERVIGKLNKKSKPARSQPKSKKPAKSNARRHIA